MPQPEYLTKSRYKLALECPRKLFYTAKPEYPNKKNDDEFLLALADGGFQVGELAKHYFPGGVEITTRNKQEALAQTASLLERDEVIIFEAAIRFEGLYVLIDVLVKKGNSIELIEVKSKTWNSKADPREEMLAKRGQNRGMPNSRWAPYLNDVAFQQFVLQKAHPGFSVRSYLMMVDKNAGPPRDGLNQKFRIVRDRDGRAHVEVSPDLGEEDLQPSVLTRVDVSDIVAAIQGHDQGPGEFDLPFEEEVLRFMRGYAEGEKMTTRPGSKCKHCEFRCTPEERESGLKDGFRECWTEMLGWDESDFDGGTVLDIWNCRKTTFLIESGISKLQEVSSEDIAPQNISTFAPDRMSLYERQSLQIEQAQNPGAGDHFEARGFEQERATWTYPLHFIDFETSAEAVPFFTASRPYDTVIFQYSHHVMHKDGRVEHAGQYLDTEPGRYPSIELLRRLKRELERDKGTIFRYHNHENTCLASLHDVIMRQHASIDDADELIGFIKRITHSTASNSEHWAGPRDMVDLCKLCQDFYLPVSSKGSTSLKRILPAILNGSRFLQDKYSEPVYGGDPAEAEIPSLNFTDQPVQWVEIEQGEVKDPYKRLPPVFDGLTPDELEAVGSTESGVKIAEGGAAMVAYRGLQFAEVSDAERKATNAALLKYCELDTLAMVMLVEGWNDMVRQK